MRSKKRKFNLAAAGALLCVTTCAISPAPTHAANGWDINLNAGELTTTESSVSITINAASSTATLSAEEGWGASKAQGIIKQTASVALSATDGYTIKISGNPNLTDGNKTIPSVFSATTLGQMNNQWGWYSAEGSTDCNETSIFKGMTTTGETVASGSLSTATTKTVTMCFGAKVDGNQAGGTYTNTVLVSAVAEPATTRSVFGGVKTMQEVTESICSAATVNDTAQLTDARDGKKYWVTKMADGNCWMNQNLDLDLGSSVIASNADGTTFTWNNSTPTTKNISSGNTSNIGTASWDLEDYVLNTPTATTACSNNTNLSACSSQGFVKVAASDGWVASGDPNFFRTSSYIGKNGVSCSKTANTAVNASASTNCKFYDAHYLVGNYYQWNAVTAGTGGSLTSGVATGSICPKGWVLPSGDSHDKGNPYWFLYQYGLGNRYGANITGSGNSSNSSTAGNTYNIALSPLFFARSGYRGDSNSIVNAGLSGNYWTSSASSTDDAYQTRANDTTVLWLTSVDARKYYGLSTRCVMGIISPSFGPGWS